MRMLAGIDLGDALQCRGLMEEDDRPMTQDSSDSSASRWPSAKGRLFAKKARNKAAKGDDPIDFLMAGLKPKLDYYYREGYYEAACILGDYMTQDGFDTLLYPMLFNLRQYLELSLKCLIETYAHCCKLDGIELQVADFQHHNLMKLWREATRVMRLASKQDEAEEETLKNVERNINEFNQMDKTSQLFRYPVDAKGQSVERRLPKVSLNDLRKTMDGLHAFFDGCKAEADTWVEYLDEMRVTELRDMYDV